MVGIVTLHRRSLACILVLSSLLPQFREGHCKAGRSERSSQITFTNERQCEMSLGYLIQNDGFQCHQLVSEFSFFKIAEWYCVMWMCIFIVHSIADGRLDYVHFLDIVNRIALTMNELIAL